MEPENTKRHRPKWIGVALKVLLWLLIAIVVLPFTLYIPPIQKLAVGLACGIVKSSTGMDVQINRFRLKFPLDLDLQGLTVLDQHADTMISAREAIVGVKPLPLLRLDIKVKKLKLIDGYYRMVSPDSSMVLSVRAKEMNADDKSSIDLKLNKINLHKADITDGSLSLFMDVWRQKPQPTDTTTTPFLINIDELKLKRFRFAMSMLPTIDTLTLNLTDGRLEKGMVDLRTNRIHIGALAASKGDACYITPTPEYIAAHPAPAPDSVESSAPFTIQADSLMLDDFNGLYATKGATPQPGFDPSYINVGGIGITIKNFYNQATRVSLPIARLEGRERSGLQIVKGTGLVEVDSTGLILNNMAVATTASALHASATVPFALMELKPDAQMSIQASGAIGLADIDAFTPAAKAFTKYMPNRPIEVDVDAAGSLAHLDISSLKAEMDHVFTLSADGQLGNPLDFKNLTVDIDFNGSLSDPAAASAFINTKGLHMPTFTLDGHATADHMDFAADFKLLSSAGNLVAEGNVGMNSERYHLDMQADALDPSRIMPDLGIGSLTGSIKATGAGFDPSKPGAHTEANLDLKEIAYAGHIYHDIKATASLGDGDYTLQLSSPDRNADISIDARGHLEPDLYTFDVRADMRHIDLKAFGLSPTQNSGSLQFTATGTASPGKWLYDVEADIARLDWNLPDMLIHLPEGVQASLKAQANDVACTLRSRGVNLTFTSPANLGKIADGFSAAAQVAQKELEYKRLDIRGIQQALPVFSLTFDASGRGLLSQFLTPSDMGIDTIYGHLNNDSLLRAGFDARRFRTGQMTIDTINLSVIQRDSLLDYNAHIGNRPQNLPEFAEINAAGYIGGDRASVYLTQRNSKGKTGYRLGLTAAYVDSTFSFHITPLKAMIAYLPWKFNLDNHISISSNGSVEAKVEGRSAESGILLRTAPDSLGHNTLHVGLDNIQIQDFLSLSIFAPPIKGSLDSDLKVRYLPKRKVIIGSGTIALRDLFYDRQRVGTFDLKFRAGLNSNGSTGARVGLNIDGREALVIRGAVRSDSIAASRQLPPLRLQLELKKFPLAIANAFIGKDVATLSGVINGKMGLTGSMADPRLNGAIACDSVNVNIAMLGSSLRFDRDSITVADNILKFNDFKIWGANSNPLTITGGVDASHITDVKIDVGLHGRKFQLMDSKRNSRSELYGKLFLNLDATAKGNQKRLDVNAQARILNQTDVYYNLGTAEATLTRQNSGDVVKFVNFNDTTQAVQADTLQSSLAMRITAELTIDPGAQATVNLSTNGTDKVQISPSGTLNYFQNYMGDMRMTGTLQFGNGFARYNVPVMGEKMFTFDPASSVTWNGDLLNPGLNIKGTDYIKASVSKNGGNSRMVDFLVTLSIGNNLERPDVLFDLSTNDDLTIQNELRSMSADQRSTQAMNLLLYGQYTGPGSKGSAAIMGNPLYGFLESQLNTWAANNIRGVDLSFGIDQYNNTTDGRSSTSMSYSYKVSKSLFSNKFKIIVGGNYSTDADADENFSQNLINDISFEYTLKQTRSLSMYLRLFRHTGYESILEGEVTETGVAFVMRRHLENLRKLFRIRFGKRRTAQPEEVSTSTQPGDTTLNRSITPTDSISAK